MSEEFEGPAGEMVLDGDGLIVDQVPEATWEALCDAGPVREKIIDFGEPYGRMVVKYRPFLSLEKSTRLADRFHMGDRKRRNSRGYMVAVLKEVLIAPRIQTQREEQLALRARSDVLLELIGETIGSEGEEMEALKSDLGNS
jgi:hypothetical protein